MPKPKPYSLPPSFSLSGEKRGKDESAGGALGNVCVVPPKTKA